MTMLKSDRRHDERPEGDDRRGFPRPPLWLNLLLLALALAGLGFARFHRDRVNTRFSNVLAEKERTPSDVFKMKSELAEKNLTREALARELDGRLKFMESLKSTNFYIAVDTEEKKFRFYYGDTILREGEVAIGEGRTITAKEGQSWTFVPMKGAFPVQGKASLHSWTIPAWVYAMNNQPVPASRQVVKGGLGDFVIFLPDNYVIHSPPAEESPLKGPKPGSFMVSEEDLRAVWPRIRKNTQVYIF